METWVGGTRFPAWWTLCTVLAKDGSRANIENEVGHLDTGIIKRGWTKPNPAPAVCVFVNAKSAQSHTSKRCIENSVTMLYIMKRWMQADERVSRRVSPRGQMIWCIFLSPWANIRAVRCTAYSQCVTGSIIKQHAEYGDYFNVLDHR